MDQKSPMGEVVLDNSVLETIKGYSRLNVTLDINILSNELSGAISPFSLEIRGETGCKDAIRINDTRNDQTQKELVIASTLRRKIPCYIH